MAKDNWKPEELCVMQYVCKPINVLAFRWGGYLDQIPKEMSHLIDTRIRLVNPNDTMYLDVMDESGKLVLTRPGDWIIFEPDGGTLRVLSDENFRQRYEKRK